MNLLPPLLLARLDDWITLIIFVILFLGPALAKMLRRGQPEEEERQRPPTRSRPTPRPAQPPPRQWTAESEEVRKFLEALGKPKTAPPPPPVLRPVPQEQPPPPRPKPPPRRPAVRPTPPPVPTIAPTVPSTPAATPAPVPQVDLAREFEEAEAEFKRAAHAAPVAVPTTEAAPTNRAREFRQMLADRSNVRRAVVLAEILAPPVALRS